MYHSLEADQKSYPAISPLNTLDHKPSIDGSIWKDGRDSAEQLVNCVVSRGSTRNGGESSHR